MNRILKVFLLIIGFISLIIGCVGIALPVLPTTPFLILSYICFFKSSEKFNRWFVGTKLYKTYVEDFVKKKGLTLKRKISIIIVADIFIITSMIIVRNFYMNIGLSIIIIFKYWYFFFKIKTIKEPSVEKVEE
ncbi:YbaN family protein [uncultured Clostridium sp.]|uniref:YbaN family protein n=1 Tax=uncultured Clostridium sp. TaxID=59620 RepID=UPI00261999D5|nr:YbaN family protein [uncultured Clostridium sp.]